VDIFPQSEDKLFFNEIEQEFIRLRVTPLQFSADDFKITREWRAAGVPLELALEVLREKIEAQREKGKEVWRRLSYYRKAVLKAWEKRQAMLAPAARPEAQAIDVAQELETLAAALPPSLEEIALAVRSLEGEPAEVEAALEELEERALEWIKAGLPEAERAGLEEEIAAAMAGLKHRLPADQLERVALSLERQLLRQKGDLPTFSILA